MSNYNNLKYKRSIFVEVKVKLKLLIRNSLFAKAIKMVLLTWNWLNDI